MSIFNRLLCCTHTRKVDESKPDRIDLRLWHLTVSNPRSVCFKLECSVVEDALAGVACSIKSETSYIHPSVNFC